MTFTLKAPELVSTLAWQPTGAASDCDDADDLDPFKVIEIPVSIKRRGNGMRLVIHGEGQRRSPDPHLVSLIARANPYLQHLTRAGYQRD